MALGLQGFNMQNDSVNEDHGQWHLNRSIPIVLISIIFIQTATIVWWASDMQGKVDLNTHARLTSQEAQIHLSNVIIRLDVTLTGLTEQFKQSRENQREFRQDIVQIKSGQAVIQSKIDQLKEN